MLEDNRKNIKQVNKLGIVVVILMAPLIWLLLMGFPPAPVAIFLASVLLPCVFLFGNTIRALFDSLVFIFVMHPFDVGDRCIVDGEEVLNFLLIVKSVICSSTPCHINFLNVYVYIHIDGGGGDADIEDSFLDCNK